MANETPHPPGGVAHPFTAFWVAEVGVFMGALDSGVVVVAMPTIAARFGVDISSVQWLLSAYLLAVSALLPICGRLADIMSRKLLYRTGFAVFTLGSALCGAAPSLSALVAARVLQGLGAAVMMAVSPAIIMDCFPDARRGRALGLNAMVVALGLLAGPGLGGVLLAHYGWPALFFVNVPFGLAGFFLSGPFLPRGESKGGERLDLPGAVLFALGLTALLAGVVHGEDWGWGSPLVLAALGLGLAGLALFVLRERRAASPMLDLSLFSSVPFTAGCAASALGYMASYAINMMLPFYLSGPMAAAPEIIGLQLTITPAVIVCVSPLAGYLSERISIGWLAAVGLGIMAGGLVSHAFLGPGSPVWRVAAGQVLCGVGFGVFNAPNNNAILGASPLGRSGVAGGVLALVRNLGMVFGIALATAVFEGVNGLGGHQVDAGRYSPTQPFFPGYRAALLTGVGLVAVAAVLGMLRGGRGR